MIASQEYVFLLLALESPSNRNRSTGKEMGIEVCFPSFAFSSSPFISLHFVGVPFISDHAPPFPNPLISALLALFPRPPRPPPPPQPPPKEKRRGKTARFVTPRGGGQTLAQTNLSCVCPALRTAQRKTWLSGMGWTALYLEVALRARPLNRITAWMPDLRC